MKLPTREECIEILDEHDVPENVRKHIFTVNKVAVFLAKKLKEAGEDVDVELVDRASLVHDLDKILTLKTGKHGHLAGKILSEKGHSRLGEIVKKHVFAAVKDNGLKTWEEKIVNYADKRCMEDEVVSLEERFRDAGKRYNKHATPETLKIEKLHFKLEKEIFYRIGMKPEELKEHVK